MIYVVFMLKIFFNKVKKILFDWKLTILLSFLVILIFFVTRLVNLTILPVFADEAIYIRWAQVMKAEASLRFLPLSVGAPPLFMWTMIPLLKPFFDPLWVGRILSVISGVFSLFGIFLVSYLLFKKKTISLISIFLYSILPFFVFSERLALIDSMLSMFGILLAALGVLLSQYQRIDLAMLMGGIFGAALLTKSPAVFFVSSISSLGFLMTWDFKEKEKTFLKFVKLVSLLLIIFGLGYFIYRFVLKLGPNFELIKFRNSLGTYNLKEVIAHPLDPLIPHVKDLFSWLPNLFTVPIFFLSFLGLFFCFVEKKKQTIYLLFWSILPLLVESVVSKVNTPRYVLFMIWPFIVFSSYALDKVFDYLKKSKNVLIYRFSIVVSILMLSFFALRYDYLLAFNPQEAPLPRNLRFGHLEEWTAGQGIKEIADYLKNLPKNQKILVGTEGSFGTLPDGLQMYLEKVPNITVIGVGQPVETIPESLTNALDDSLVFLVVNDERLSFNPETEKVTVVNRFPKAIRSDGTFQSLLLMKIDKVLK